MSCVGLSWQDCAVKTKSAIREAKTPEAALRAYGDFAARFRTLYEAHKHLPVAPSDLDRFEDYVSSGIESLTDPINWALDQAIAKFFPKIAACLGLASGVAGTLLWTFLVPSPILTDLQEAQLVNADLARMVSEKLAPLLRYNWQNSLDDRIKSALSAGTLPKP